MRATLFRSRRTRYVLAAMTVLLVPPLVWWGLQRPSNDRDWQPNMAVLPWAEFTDSTVTVHNVRNTSYVTTADYTPRYASRRYVLRNLKTVWFIVEPLASWGVAHTFLSFGFTDGRYLTISVEARKERGESYSVVGGMLRRYELMYVIADERDAIGLRAVTRQADVYLYPVRTTPERIRALFLDMLEAATALRDEPRFYNTLTANCTNLIVRHVNALVPDRVPFSYKVILPGYSDELAYDLGLIDTDLPFPEVRERARISVPARQYLDSADFSRRLREVYAAIP